MDRKKKNSRKRFKPHNKPQTELNKDTPIERKVFIVRHDRTPEGVVYHSYVTFFDYPIRMKLIIDNINFGKITIDYHPDEDLPIEYDRLSEEIHPLILDHAIQFTEDIATALKIGNSTSPLSDFYRKPCVKSLFKKGHDVTSLIHHEDTFRILRKHGPEALRNLPVLTAISEWFDSPISLAINLAKMSDALLGFQKEDRGKPKTGPVPVEILPCLRRERFLSIYRLFADAIKEARKEKRSSDRKARIKEGHCDKSIYKFLEHALVKQVRKKYFVDHDDGSFLRIERPDSEYADDEDYISDFIFELIMATKHPFEFFAERNFTLKKRLEEITWVPNEIAKLVLADLFHIKYSTLENYIYRAPKSKSSGG
jgi:hypothetical protein